MKLVLVRHGETEWNRERRIIGHSDLALNDKGQRQAQAVGVALASPGVHAIYSSPLRRAMDTAQAIAQHHGLQVVPLPGLIELDAGKLDGLTGSEARNGYGPFFEKWVRGDPDLATPGGESLAQVQERAWSVVEDLRERHREDTVVLVSHHFVLLTLLCRALGLPVGHFRRLRHTVAAVSMLDFSGIQATLSLLNDTCHLDNI